MVKYLVRKLGADVNQTTKTGHTPMFIAAENGFLDVVKCLVKELGAHPHPTTIYGSTPLFMAAYNGNWIW
jgi:ankyrin repeat protein